MKEQSSRYNWPLVGNQQIVNYLEKCLDKGRIPSGLVFNGPENLGKTTAAIRFAKILLCQGAGQARPCGSCPACLSFKKGEASTQDEGFSHSDFYLVKKDKDKQNLAVEQIRDLIRSVSLSSFLGSYKIGIVKHADTMSLEAANALLKTLEEPRDKVVLILITGQLDKLPLTIKSRCQVLNFRPVDSDTIYDYLLKEKQARRSQAKEIASISIGRPALAVKLLEDPELLGNMKAQAEAFLKFGSLSVNSRLKYLNELLPAKDVGQAARTQAMRILEVWQAVVRDCLLYETGHINLLQFGDPDRLRAMGVSKQKTARWYRLLKDAQSRLADNVNYRSVLENVAMQAF